MLKKISGEWQIEMSKTAQLDIRSSIKTVVPPSRKSCILAKTPRGISNSVQITFGVCVRVCV